MKDMTAALLYCMGRGLNQETVSPERLSALCGDDFPGLFRLARRHSVSALAAWGIVRAGLPADIVTPWRNASNVALRRAMLLDAERRDILSRFDAAGIWYLPLKGVVLQTRYPAYGLREMSDNDILHAPDAWPTVRDWMTERGYRQETPAGRGKDIAYFRAPFYRFEMHTALFNATEPVFQAYYKDVKTRLSPDPETVCGCRFSDEDFYIYLLAHAFHHFRYAGIGLRTLADVFVWRRADMDAAYLRREFALLGLTDFAQTLEALSRKVFDFPWTLSTEEQSLLDCLSASGTFGTEAQATQNLLRQIECPTTWNYCLTRLRNAAKQYQRDMAPGPALLYPLYLAGCLTRDAVRSRKKILRELRTVRKPR